jgi:hypothetical protein
VPEEVVTAPSLNSSKSHLDKFWPESAPAHNRRQGHCHLDWIHGKQVLSAISITIRLNCQPSKNVDAFKVLSETYVRTVPRLSSGHAEEPTGLPNCRKAFYSLNRALMLSLSRNRP